MIGTGLVCIGSEPTGLLRVNARQMRPPIAVELVQCRERGVHARRRQRAYRATMGMDG
jgi:hypothetical protein